MNKKLERFKGEIHNIRRGNYRGRIKPHKPLMLLAVLDLINIGVVNKNRIPFDDLIRERFQELFTIAHKEGDWCHPSEPFFHLRTSGFWFHKPRKGREKICAELDTSGGGTRRIYENIEYAFFDPDSYEVLMDDDMRWIVTEMILEEFFDLEERERLLQYLKPRYEQNEKRRLKV